MRGYQDVTPLHCCAGILICYCKKVGMDKAESAVCDPATEGIWAVLTSRGHELLKHLYAVRLCFDPAIPRRFTVFLFRHSFDGIIRVEVYSETGQWTNMHSEWSPESIVLEDSRCIFFNGALHLASRHSVVTLDGEENLIRSIVTVDTVGKACKGILMPHDIGSDVFVQFQGRLCAARIDHENGCQLSVWVL